MADLRNKVVLEFHKEEEHRQEHQPLEKAKAERLQNLARELTKTADYVTITGNGGSPIYAYGNKNVAIDYGDPSSWIKTEENIWLSAHPSLDSELPMCPIQDVSNAEIHVGETEVYRLGDCSQTKCAEVNRDHIMYCYVFDKHAAGRVSLLLVLQFGPISNHVSRGLSRDMEDIDFHTNPSRFQNEEIQHVWFSHLAFRASSESADE